MVSKMASKKKDLKKSVEQSNNNVDGTNDDDMPEKLEGVAVGEDTEKSNRTLKENQQVNVTKKYVSPLLGACTSKKSEVAQIRCIVRGLLNKLAESNVEQITGEMSSIFQTHSRSVSFQIIGEEVVASCAVTRGFAAVFAAFVAGMACIVGTDFGANLIASVAMSFEEEYSKDDGRSLGNFALLLSYLYMFGVFSSDLIYDLLSILSKRLTEKDVSTILTILQCCGMKLRSDDPTAMEYFMLNIQRQSDEAKLVSENGENSNAVINSIQMDIMLDTIRDIKNNKKKPKDEQQYTRMKTWLQKLGSEKILLHGLTWKKVIDPEKKGLWWLSGESAAKPDNTEDVAATIDKDIPETKKLMQLEL